MKKMLLSFLLFSLIVISVGAQQQAQPVAAGIGDQHAVPTMYNDDAELNLVCCYSYGYGTEMVKVNEEYKFTTEEDCAVEEGFVGGNKEIVDDDFCENDDDNEDIQPELISARKKIKAETKEQLKEMIQERKVEIEEETKEKPEKKQPIIRNQNKVRLAVHAMLAMEDLTNGIGRNISAIARGFNNSVKTTLAAEEKIQKKSKFARFLTGGDEEAAEELEQEVEQNRIRVRELKKLMGECEDCEADVMNLLQEQIQNMEQEQNRLSELAQKEKSRKGLFGWLFK